MAMAVEMKLVQDVAALQAYNKATDESNERISMTLQNVTGKDLGKNIDDWRAWWADQQGYVFEPERPRSKPTYTVRTPIAFIGPDAAIALSMLAHTACFAAGTPVRTSSARARSTP